MEEAERVELPGKRELGELAWYATSAFVLRCSQRIWPLVESEFRHLASGTIEAIKPLFASTDATWESSVRLASEARRRGLGELIRLRQNQSTESTSSRLAGMDAVISVIEVITTPTPGEMGYFQFSSDSPTREAEASQHTQRFLDVADSAVKNAAIVLVEAIGPSAIEVIRRDFELAKSQRQTYSLSMIDMHLFGPLWPDGLPEAWP